MGVAGRTVLEFNTEHNKVTTIEARHETTQLNWDHKAELYILFRLRGCGCFYILTIAGTNTMSEEHLYSTVGVFKR